MTKAFLILSTIVALNIPSGNQCKKCDTKKRVELSEAIQKYTYYQIENFICTFDKKCRNNAEFSEVSNTHLFEVIETYPKLFVSVLDKLDNNQLSLILWELENPIQEVDIQGVFTKICSVKENLETIEKIKESLVVAGNRTGTTIK